MYPNPQAAFPLPSRPNLEQYKKRAKDLVKACRSGEPDAIRTWAAGWKEVEREVDEIVPFAQSRLARTDAGCALTDAQFVIARIFGFASWPKFAAHVQALERAQTGTAVFESAVDAIVAGDADAVGRILKAHPDLIPPLDARAQCDAADLPLRERRRRVPAEESEERRRDCRDAARGRRGRRRHRRGLRRRVHHARTRGDERAS